MPSKQPWTLTLNEDHTASYFPVKPIKGVNSSGAPVYAKPGEYKSSPYKWFNQDVQNKIIVLVDYDSKHYYIKIKNNIFMPLSPLSKGIVRVKKTESKSN